VWGGATSEDMDKNEGGTDEGDIDDMSLNRKSRLILNKLK